MHVPATSPMLSQSAPDDTKQLYVNESTHTDNIPVCDWVHCTVIESNQIKAEQLKHN